MTTSAPEGADPLEIAIKEYAVGAAYDISCACTEPAWVRPNDSVSQFGGDFGLAFSIARAATSGIGSKARMLANEAVDATMAKLGPLGDEIAAARQAGKGTTRTIAIGEDMTNRVIPYAKRVGAEVYKPDPNMPRSQWLQANRNWINKAMDEGCTILDCGPAPGRANFPAPTSPYYRAELEDIGARAYPNYWPVNIGD